MKNILFYFALILNIIVIALYFVNDTTKDISVEIKGYVKNPGVYKIKSGSTVNTLINISGGLLEEGNTELNNLAKVLNNEDVVVIYSNEEVNSFRNGTTSIKYIEKECVCPRIDNNSCLREYISLNDEIVTSAKVSLNSATKEELLTLPSIGESKALAIIEYRNTNNGFKSIEDIMNVKGIGKSVFEKIKPYITL